MIFASGEVGFSVMGELCQCVLDGKRMANKCASTNFQEKGDVRNCYTYRRVKLLDHTMKIVEKVLERRIRELVNIDSMQFGFMPGRGTTDALFVVDSSK